MELIFEKKAISFEQFLVSNQDDVNEGALKNIALATLLGASSLAGYAGGKDTGKDIGTEVVKGKKIYTDISGWQKNSIANHIKNGWTIEQRFLSEYIDQVMESEGKMDSLVYELELGQGFESGLFVLNQESKDKIDSLFREINDNEHVVSKVAIESSTDKTPISKRMTDATGIRDNKDLSEKRAESIISYLSESGLVSDDNKTKIEKNLLVEQGGINDPSARYVKFVVYTLDASIPDKQVGPSQTSRDVTYRLSREPYKMKKHKKGRYSPKTVISEVKENVMGFKAKVCAKP